MMSYDFLLVHLIKKGDIKAFEQLFRQSIFLCAAMRNA